MSRETFFAGYGAAIDFPVSLFYGELMQVYPAAKVFLTLRDPATWYDSITTTLVTKPRARIDELLDIIKAPFSPEHRMYRRCGTRRTGWCGRRCSRTNSGTNSP